MSGPAPDRELAGALGDLVAAAVADGEPAPAWVAVDDGSAEAVRAGLCGPGAERARAVVAVRDENGLARAVRLGFGGATLLPASTPSVVAALRAAAQAPLPATMGECAAAPSLLLELPGPHLLLYVSGARLWRRQLGLGRLGRRLFEATRTLGVPAARLPGPALLLAGISAAEASAGLGGDSLLETAPVEAPADDASLLALLATVLARPAAGPAGVPRPVFELPGGRRVGRWSPAPVASSPPGREWLAWPEAETPVGHRWRLVDAMRGEWVLEDDPAGLSATGEAPAIRIPGWLTEDLRRGSPSGVLVEHAARRSARLGRPLWLPELDRTGLEVALRLGPRVWVDGPAVPAV